MSMHQRHIILLLAVLAGPSALVLAPSYLSLPSGPASTNASPGELNQAPPVEYRAAKPTDAQTAAAAHATALRPGIFGASPLYVVPTVVVAEPIEIESSTSELPPVELPDASGIAVTSIINGTGGQALAVINGKVRRVQDELGEGWMLVAIDPVSRCVTIRHTSLDEVVLALPER